MGQWIHRKFMLESNFQHFTESLFTPVLNCKIPFKYDSCIPTNCMRNHGKNLLNFLLKSQKICEIVIHRFQGSHNWWNEKSRSHSIHVNFNHDPSLNCEYLWSCKVLIVKMFLVGGSWDLLSLKECMKTLSSSIELNAIDWWSSIKDPLVLFRGSLVSMPFPTTIISCCLSLNLFQMF